MNNRVLIQPDEKEERVTASGFIVPDSNKEKPVTGVVVVGNETVKKGDRVLFSKFGYDEFKIDDEVFYVVSESLILGIYE